MLAYSVSQRLEEIGIRVALGAQRRDILRLVVGQGLLLTLIGTGVGLAASFLLVRSFSAWLFDAPLWSPLPFVGVPFLLLSVALLALRLDPMAVSRYE